VNEMIEGVRQRYLQAMPKPAVNPAWANSHHDLGILLSALEAKDKLIAELVEALQPFAEQADRYDPPENDSGHVAWSSPFHIGDLRGARSAILRAKEQE
jgi:hypothetical protein